MGRRRGQTVASNYAGIPVTSMSIPCFISAIRPKRCWREIVAPLLLVLAEESELTIAHGGELGQDHLRSLFAKSTTATIRGAGHMIHHERPEETAAPLEHFLDL